MSKPLRDLTGVRFGKLVVLKPAARNDKGRFRWLCQCDCGNTTAVVSNHLKPNDAKNGVKSCGCSQREHMRKMGRANAIPDSGLMSLMSRYRSCATERKLSFSLSKEEFKKLTSSNCEYCGQPPSRISKTPYSVFENRYPGSWYIYTGVDRVDNSKGYELGNCVPCCTTCNSAKSDTTSEEFEGWISRLVQYRNSQVSQC